MEGSGIRSFDPKPALVRIVTSRTKPTTAGTGWIVDREQGLIVTADHVIASIEEQRKKRAKTVFVQFFSELMTSVEEGSDKKTPCYGATVLQDYRDGNHDVCLLKVTKLPPDVIALPPGEVDSARAEVDVYGFPDTFKGDVVPVRTALKGLLPEESSGLKVYQLEGDQEIKGGFSGGPVINLATGHVVGLIRSIRTDPKSGIRLRVSVRTADSIRAVYPQLPPPVRAFDPAAARAAEQSSLIRDRLLTYAKEIVAGTNGRNLYNEVGERFTASNNRQKVRINLEAYFPITGFELTGRDRDRTVDQLPRPTPGGENTEELAELEDFATGAEAGVLTELAERIPRMLLRAGVGSGKSTTLKAITVRDAQAFAAGDEAKGVTIYLRARRFQPGGGFEGMLLRELGMKETSTTEDYVSALKSYPGLRICIDGLNEVPTSRLQDAREDLQVFVERFPAARFIITDRPSVFADVPLEEQLGTEFRVFDLRPLQSTDYDKYLTRLLIKRQPPIERERKAVRNERLAAMATELLAPLRKNNATERLLGNPLHLDLIAQLGKSAEGVVRRGEIFERFSREVVLNKWSKTDNLTDRREISRLLEQIAYRIINHSSLTRKDLVFYVGRTLDLPKLAVRKITEELLRSATSVGLLVDDRETGKRGKKSYRFQHDAFRDYYAARYVAKKFGKKGRLPKQVDREEAAWLETLLLVGELLGEDKAAWRQYYDFLKGKDMDASVDERSLPVEYAELTVKDYQQHVFRNAPPDSTPPPTNLLVLGAPTDVMVGNLRIAPLTAALARQRIENYNDEALRREEVDRLLSYLKLWAEYRTKTGKELVPAERIFSALALLDLKELRDYFVCEPDMITLWAASNHHDGLLVDQAIGFGNASWREKYVAKDDGSDKKGKNNFEAGLKKRRSWQAKVMGEQLNALHHLSARILRAYTDSLDEPWKMYGYLNERSFGDYELRRREANKKSDADFWSRQKAQAEDFRPKAKILPHRIITPTPEQAAALAANIKAKKKTSPSKKKSLSLSIGPSGSKADKEVPLAFRRERFVLRRYLLEAIARKNPEELKTIYQNQFDPEVLPLIAVEDEDYFLNALGQLEQRVRGLTKEGKKTSERRFSLLQSRADYLVKTDSEESPYKEKEKSAAEIRALQLAKQIIKAHPRIHYSLRREIAAQESIDDLITFYRNSSRLLPVDLIKQLESKEQTAGEITDAERVEWLRLMAEQEENYYAYSVVLGAFGRRAIGTRYTTDQLYEALRTLIDFGAQQKLVTEPLALNFNQVFAKTWNLKGWFDTVYRVIAQLPRGEAALRLRLTTANWRLKAEKFEEAETHAKRALEEYPEELYPLFMLAKCYSKQRKYHQAIECYEKILAIEDDNIVAIGAMGYAHYKLEDHESAIRYFLNEIKQQTDNTQASRYLGRSYRETGKKKMDEARPEEALEDFHKAEKWLRYAISESRKLEDEDSEEEAKAVNELLDLYAQELSGLKVDILDDLINDLVNSQHFTLARRATLSRFFDAHGNREEAVALWEEVLSSDEFAESPKRTKRNDKRISPQEKVLRIIDYWKQSGHRQLALRVTEEYQKHQPENIYLRAYRLELSAEDVYEDVSKPYRSWRKLYEDVLGVGQKDLTKAFAQRLQRWVEQRGPEEARWGTELLLDLMPDIPNGTRRAEARQQVVQRLESLLDDRYKLKVLSRLIAFTPKKRMPEMLDVAEEVALRTNDLASLFSVYDDKLANAPSRKQKTLIHRKRLNAAINAGDNATAYEILHFLLDAHLLPKTEIKDALSSLAELARSSKNKRGEMEALVKLVNTVPKADNFKRRTLLERLYKVVCSLKDGNRIKKTFSSILATASSKNEKTKLFKKHFWAVKALDKQEGNKKGGKKQQQEGPATLPPHPPHTSLPPSQLIYNLLAMQFNAAILADVHLLRQNASLREVLGQLDAMIDGQSSVKGISLRKAYYAIDDTAPEDISALTAANFTPIALRSKGGIQRGGSIALDVVELLASSTHIDVFVVVAHYVLAELLAERLAIRNKRLVVIGSLPGADIPSYPNCVFLDLKETADPVSPTPGKPPIKSTPNPAQNKAVLKKDASGVSTEVFVACVRKVAKGNTLAPEASNMAKRNAFNKLISRLAKDKRLSGHFAGPNQTINKFRTALTTVVPDLNYKDFGVEKLKELMRLICTDSNLAVYEVEGEVEYFLGFRQDFHAAANHTRLPDYYAEEPDFYYALLTLGDPYLPLFDDRDVQRTIIGRICELAPDGMERGAIIEVIQVPEGPLAEPNNIKKALALMQYTNAVTVEDATDASPKTYTLKEGYKNYFAWRDRLIERCAEIINEKTGETANESILQSML